jgi:NAD(P)-dependent dehydrogenase (short-subunit alcohol dehydrogenase family)
LFLERGFSVVAVDVSADGLQWASDDKRVRTVVGDVSAEETNASMVNEAIEHFGRLDAAILNAGIAGRFSVEDDDAMARFDLTMAVNVRGVVLGIRHAAPLMAAAGGGTIVVVASTSGVGGDPGLWAYNTSKGAVVNLVRATSLDYALRGVRINALAPGPTETPIIGARGSTPEGLATLIRPIPMQRLGRAREQAEVAWFLASPAASFITGQTLVCDGGVTASTGQFLPPQRA